MIQIIVNNVWSRISGLQDIEIIENLDKITSYYVEGYKYTRAFTAGYYDYKKNKFVHWDGKKHLLTRNLVFPTGLLKRIEKFLTDKNVTYQIEDKRENIIFGEELSVKFYPPRPYQIEAVSVAIKEGRVIVRVGTGGGKTAIAAMITAKYNIPTMIYVVGKDLLYQFHNEFKKMLDVPVGMIGDGKCEIEKINICSIWTAITAFDLNIQISLIIRHRSDSHSMSTCRDAAP